MINQEIPEISIGGEIIGRHHQKLFLCIIIQFKMI